MPGKPPTNRGLTPTGSPVAIDASSKRPARDDVTASDSKPDAVKTSGGDLFIVDNSDAEWKVRRYDRMMAEIDETIEQHGSWPDAFITNPEELKKLS